MPTDIHGSSASSSAPMVISNLDNDLPYRLARQHVLDSVAHTLQAHKGLGRVHESHKLARRVQRENALTARCQLIWDPSGPCVAEDGLPAAFHGLALPEE